MEEQTAIINSSPCETGSRSRVALILILLVIVAVGCGGGRDDRDGIRSSLGEPGDIEYTEGPFSDREIWTYFDYPEQGRNKEFWFERTRNACGGSDNWINVGDREYTPDSSSEVDNMKALPGNTDSPNPIKP